MSEIKHLCICGKECCGVCSQCICETEIDSEYVNGRLLKFRASELLHRIRELHQGLALSCEEHKRELLKERQRTLNLPQVKELQTVIKHLISEEDSDKMIYLQQMAFTANKNFQKLLDETKGEE